MQDEPDTRLPARCDAESVNTPVDGEGNTYLHELCAKNAPVSRLRDAVENLGADLDALNKNKLPPLALAIEHADTQAAACLIDMGCRLMMPVGEGLAFNALLFAVHTGREGMVQLLIERGGAIGANEPGMNAKGAASEFGCLYTAIENNRADLARALLAAGALPDRKSGSGATSPLMFAAQRDRLELAQILVDGGASLDLADKDGWTALHFAARFGHMGVLRFLLESGADVNAAARDGVTPLMLGAEQGRKEVVLALIAAGADVNMRAPGKEGQSALMFAAAKDHAEVALEILSAGANPMLTDSFNKMASARATTGEGDLRAFLESEETLALARHFEAAHRDHTDKAQPHQQGKGPRR